MKTKKLAPARGTKGEKKEKKHFPVSVNQTWKDFTPAPYFVEQAFFAKMYVEDFIENYYS